MHVLLWRGDVAASVFAAALTLIGFQVEPNDLGVTLPKINLDTARRGLEQIARFRTTDLNRLTEQVQGLRSAKLDTYVPEPVLRRFWSRRHADVIGQIPQIAAEYAMQKVPDT